MEAAQAPQAHPTVLPTSEKAPVFPMPHAWLENAWLEAWIKLTREKFRIQKSFLEFGCLY